MLAYLDTNVMISLEEKELTIPGIRDAIDPSIDEFPYSAAHLHEAREIQGKDESLRLKRIATRLQTIRQTTNSLYLHHQLADGNVYRRREDPFTVWETINDVPVAVPVMKCIVSLIPEPMRASVRRYLKIDPKDLNNYTPAQVVDQLNTKLAPLGTGMTLMEMLEWAISFHPDGASFGLSHRIGGLFQLLDMLGYWSDKKTARSDYARHWDAEHAFFASFCEIFVSNDRRTRAKAKVVYSMFGLSTEVLAPNGGS